MRTGRVAASVLSLVFSVAALAAEEPATTELRALFDEAWEQGLRDDPLRASDVGDRRYAALWPDMSSAAIERRHAADVAILARLDRIDRARLSASDQLNYDLFAYKSKRRVTAHPFKPWLYDLRAREGIQSLSAVTESLPFATVADYENWLARLRSIDRYIEQYTEQLRIGIRERRVQPRDTMQQVEQSFEALISIAEPAASPFYRPFLRIPESIAAADRARLQAQGKQAIETVVRPAYQRFEKFFRTVYRPKSRANVGVWDTADGEAFYGERVAFSTTTSLSPALRAMFASRKD